MRYGVCRRLYFQVIVVCRRWYVQRDMKYVEDGVSWSMCQMNVKKIGCMSKEVCHSEYVRGNVLGDRRNVIRSSSGGMFQRD